MTKKPSLAVIVPCFNEEQSIPQFFSSLELFCASPERSDLSELTFYFIENNSTDKSLSLLQMLTLQSKARAGFKILTCNTQGYGAALKFGFSAATEEYVCFLDLDNTYPLGSAMPLLNQVQKNNLDICFGARLHRHSAISPIRRIGNLFFVCLLKLLYRTGLNDVCTGMRVFRNSKVREVIDLLERNDLSFTIEFTSLVLKLKWNYDQLDIPYSDRTGESKLTVFADGLKFLIVALRARLR